MKVVLSRKGFDSASGGLCNPILPDGTLLSMPIPGTSKNPVYYKDLHFDVKDADGNSHEMSYDEILSQLGGNKWEKGQQCHLDPDLREGIIERKQDFIPAFGQCGVAKKFLDEMDVEVGDLFLFFGRFRETEFSSEGKLQYKRNATEQHIIFGYMQVGEVLHNYEIDKHFKWHPHAENGKENNLYLPTKRLTLNPDMPGAGVLSYSHKRVLTKYGMSISKWNLPDFFRGLNFYIETSTHKLLRNFHDAPDGQEYFQFLGRGQEFLISVYEKDTFAKFYQKSLEEWAYRILIDDVWDEVLTKLREEKLHFDFGAIDKVETIINGVTAYDDFGRFDGLYMDQLAYCRYYHRIMDFDVERCSGCPLLQGGGNGRGADCLFDVPVKQGKLLELPYTPRDRFAFYEILIQKGIVQRKDNSWDLV